MNWMTQKLPDPSRLRWSLVGRSCFWLLALRNRGTNGSTSWGTLQMQTAGKGHSPRAALSPRAVVDAIGLTDIPMRPTVKDPVKVQPSQGTRDPAKTLKPILKTRPSQMESGKVPAIRIPRRLPNDPMEACGDSTRRSSIRFNDDVERREFQVSRADPVPANMRAHESRKKPSLGTVKARTGDGQEVVVRPKPKAPPSPKGDEAQTVLASPHSEILEGFLDYLGLNEIMGASLGPCFDVSIGLL